MSTRLVAVFLVVAVSLAPAAVALQQAPAEPDLEEGIRQAQMGDFEKAVVTLDGAARRLAAEGGRSRELARAYVYLSIAYLGLSQEQKAKAQFLEALKADTEMELDEGEFPPRILEFFEEAREEAVAEGVVEPPPTTPSPTEPEPAEPEPLAETPAPAAAPEKKGGGSKTLLLVGGGAAAAAGIALAAGGGGDNGPAAAPQPVEEWIEVFSTQVPQPIPDLSQAFSQLNVSQVGTIQEATLEFRIRHSCRLDLSIELRHPDGTTFTAEAPDDCQELWEGPLAFSASGKPSNGTWSLTVVDRYDGDDGTLETWGVRLRIRR
jgi:hypothetical protein